MSLFTWLNSKLYSYCVFARGKADGGSSKILNKYSSKTKSATAIPRNRTQLNGINHSNTKKPNLMVIISVVSKEVSTIQLQRLQKLF